MRPRADLEWLESTLTRRGVEHQKEQIIRQGFHPHPGPGTGADPSRDSGGGVWAYVFLEEAHHVPLGSDAVDEPEEVWEVMRREWLHDKEQKRLAIDDEELSRLVGKFLSEATARKEEAATDTTAQRNARSV